ncbi:MAG: hypothetical protein KQH79_12995 [Bacteroidetes bacterium]|nr:hypothetical protein [Bacteroidota bacterium]
MNKIFKKIINYRKYRLQENQENKSFQDAEMFFRLLYRKAKSGYLHKKYPNKFKYRLNHFIRVFSGDSNANTKRKLNEIITKISFQTGKNIDHIDFAIALEKCIKQEKIRDLIYRVSKSLYLLLTRILFPVLLVISLIYLTFPRIELKMICLLGTALLDLIFILWMITSINTSQMNHKTVKWIQSYFHKLKNKPQEIILTQNRIIRKENNILKKEVRNIQRIVAYAESRGEIDKSGKMDYHDPRLIASLFYMLWKNNIITKSSNITKELSDTLFSIFDFKKYRPSTIRNYFGDGYYQSPRFHGEAKELLEKTRYRIQNSINPLPKEIEKIEFEIPLDVKKDVTTVIKKLKESGFEVNDEKYFQCMLEVSFTKIEKTERLRIDQNIYNIPFLLKVHKKLDKLIENTIKIKQDE